uniref:Septin n=1 Tax=Rhabditophanes sp. KR3021 TaxID=114890 RepID=A0AC35TQS6_9BILA
MSESSKAVHDTEYVGIGHYTNQFFRRASRNGLEFTLMVVGQSGLGKSTFIDSLFQTDLISSSAKYIPSAEKIRERKFNIFEDNTKLQLTIVDTPAFGDMINNCYCWRPIVDYIDKMNSNYLKDESDINRKTKIPDNRVHLCLYFISPNGHGMKELDIKFLSKLHDKVNVIPVIAKADTLTTIELERLKSAILFELDVNDINVYHFPSYADKGSYQTKSNNPIPYAVICSNLTVTKEGGKKIRAREYPWGVVEIENLTHNDFQLLKDDILKKHLIDLIEDTANVHYENYRFTQLGKLLTNHTEVPNDIMTHVQRELDRHEEKFKSKTASMERIFNDKVREREQLLELKKGKVEEFELKYELILAEKMKFLQNLSLEVNKMRLAYNLRGEGLSDKSSMG